MNDSLSRWRKAGYEFRLEWLLRNVNAVVTGEALFSFLSDTPIDSVRTGLKSADKLVSHLLDVVAGRLGLDHDRVLFARYAFPVMARYLFNNNGKFATAADQDRLLYWYVHAGMWGRFAGSTESVLNQDLDAIDTGGLDALIDNIRQMRGDLTVRPSDFAGYSIGARFYPMLYLLTRTLGARDLGTGIALSAQMLGHLSSLQVHHIFPKARLYKAGYQQWDINAVANFCFLTQETNLAIGAADPAEYFPRVEKAHPGVLASHWIPMDSKLWNVDRYQDFLEARRELLAQASNDFLASLLAGTATDAGRPGNPVTILSGSDDGRVAEVDDLILWLVDRGFGLPERDVEVVDPDTGRVLAVAEAHWPSGLQEGLGQPVVLELDPDDADEDALASLGYRTFATISGLRHYVERLDGTPG